MSAIVVLCLLVEDATAVREKNAEIFLWFSISDFQLTK